MTTMRRTATALLSAVLLLLPSLVAYADDPDPVEWPSVDQPSAGSGGTDPQPAEWPAPEPL
jgi:hypothetical protein